MIVYLCSCEFATDDADWFDGHLDEHPGHCPVAERRVRRDRPAGHRPGLVLAHPGRHDRRRRALPRRPDAEIWWPSITGSPYAGQIWAIEIELTAKHADRTAAIMTGLSAPAGYTHVYYLTAPPRAAS